MRVTVIASVMAGVVAAVPGARAQTASAIELQPHRANYALTMLSAKSSSQFIDLKGATSTLLERTCDGWIVAERVAMNMDTAVGGRIQRDVRFTGWESKDGLSYRFASRALTDGRSEDFKGRAALQPDAGGTAKYSLPPDTSLELPPKTVFYVTFTRWLVEQAVAGRSHGEVIVFDGADDDGPERAVVFITPASESELRKAKRDLGPLVDGRSWTMRIAFYPLDQRVAEPDFEVETHLYENGIATRFRIEFADFTVLQEALAIEGVAPPEC